MIKRPPHKSFMNTIRLKTAVENTNNEIEEPDLKSFPAPHEIPI